jgi:hypothetical protein
MNFKNVVCFQKKMRKDKLSVLDRLRQLLKNQPNLESVAHVVDRVFQRAPQKSQRYLVGMMKINNKKVPVLLVISVTGIHSRRLRDEAMAMPKSRQKLKLISLFLEEIEMLVDNPDKAR